jgi:hypothetical protein
MKKDQITILLIVHLIICTREHATETPWMALVRFCGASHNDGGMR